jgi:hypothetical protein
MHINIMTQHYCPGWLPGHELFEVTEDVTLIGQCGEKETIGVRSKISHNE